MTAQLTKWYGLNTDGDIVCLGEYESFDEADEAGVGRGIVWIVDAEAARSWLVQLKELLV